MDGYSVKISESSKELSGKEKVAIKDTTDTVRLDEATKLEPVIIDVDYYALLDIHNEKADDKDYTTIVVVDKQGTRYTTGSESFMTTFLSIFDDMRGETEPYSVKAYRMPSKNYRDKEFLTCSIV